MEEAAIRSSPEFAAAVFEHRADKLIGQPFVGPVSAKAAIAVMKYSAAIGRNPQRSVPRHSKGADVLICDCRRVEARVDNKTHAVEPGQPSGSSDPEISVRSLRDGANAALGKAILGAPDAAHVPGWLDTRIRRRFGRA